MIDYGIKKLTKDKTLKDGSIIKYTWYEILFYVKTAKEQFLFDEVTKTHSEYQTPFINFLDYYKEDNGKAERVTNRILGMELRFRQERNQRGFEH